MRREPFRASAVLGLVAGLALPAIAGNRTQQPAAKPEPAHPAVRPAATHPADAAAKPAAARPVEAAAPAQPAPASGIVQPVAASAKPAPREAQGGDAKPPPTPPDKVQKERQEKERQAAEAKEKERIEKAREQEKAKAATPAKPGEAARPAAAGPGSAAEQRVVAKKAAHFEQNYRNRQARIDRLIRIYKGKGDTAKVAHLEQLKAQQEKRRANAMEGFRKELSADNWGKLNSEMKKERAAERKPAPASPTPGTRPTTPPKSGG